jgi:RNA-directed DNA polymerase
MAQTWRWDMGRQRIDARAFLHLIRPGLQAGMLATAGQVVPPATGTPQGGTVSPVLAPGELPYALAIWFEQVVPPPGRGAALGCRYAEAGGGAFRWQEDAERFLRGLPQR